MSKQIKLIVPDDACLICNYVYHDGLDKLTIGQLVLGNEDIKRGKEYDIDAMEDGDMYVHAVDKVRKIVENCSQNNYYYKYNGKYLKSEIIEQLQEALEEVI